METQKTLNSQSNLQKEKPSWENQAAVIKRVHQKMWNIYTMEYYSAIKKNNAICSNTDGPRDYLTG